jgi:GNAT superfamily N-acetyltransferase
MDAEPPAIRLAREDELPLLIEIERAAGAIFRDLGMDAVADDDPGSFEELAAFQRGGRVLVYPDGQGRPVAYLLLGVIDGYAHVEQVSVHPSHSRQGIGRQLVEAADQWAGEHDLAGLALTTYARVPWNAPYYERLGFHALPEPAVPAGLRAVREHEAERGLDAWPRVVMVRALRSSHPSGTD